MDEWGDLDARLERKKRVKLRRQQRELKKQQKQLDALEKERQKLSLRCTEMAREDALSVAMMRLYREQERQQRRDIQREKDMKVYEQVASVRRRAKALGLPLETPGMSGKQRLTELTERVKSKEKSIETAVQAKERLDALPKKRNRVRRLLESFFTSSTRAKVERAVYESRCEALVKLLDPKIPGKRCDPSLLNHESENGLTPVLCTIYQGKLSLLRKLLELGASPDFYTRAGTTPLLACVLVDNVVALHILVEFRVNLLLENKGGVKALLFAADKGRNVVVKALLRLGVSVDDANACGRTPLMQAVMSGHYDTTRILLAFNANKAAVDSSGRTALELARHWKFDPIAALLSASTSSKTLHTLVQEQDECEVDAPNRLVREVIKHEGKAPGTVAMETALGDGNVARVLELLSVDDIGYGPNFETSTGLTPLLLVSEKGSSKDVLLCLERRCSPTHCNREGVNALMKAAYRGQEQTLQLLIRANCSMWNRDTQGRDAWRYLHDNEHHDLTRHLMKSSPTPPESPCLRLSQPVEDATRLRSLLISTKEVTVPDNPSTEPQNDEGGESDESRASDDMSSADSHDGDDHETADEWNKRQRWSTQRRVLRGNKSRNGMFEAERQKMWKYAERGRRNGLIAPLPNDKAGRLKFPPCDNCHDNRARKRCFLCDQLLCDKCHARLHELPHRRHHDYEEVEPTLMLGARLHDEVVANQEDSLKGALVRSLSCVETIRQELASLPSPMPKAATDFEVDKNERKQRAVREKEIAQTQINVPVAAAKHAIKAGEGDIYTNPAEIELADLYITQAKLTKARTLMETTKQATEDSLGYLHPTMLKIQIRLARIEQHSGDLNRSIDIVKLALGTFEGSLPPDNKDLAMTQDLGLQVLYALADYAAGVVMCQRIHRLRLIGLPRSHGLIQQAQKNLDTFIAKAELELMRKEDLLVLGQIAMNAEQAEKHRIEQERKLAEFRTMLLDQVPVDRYNSFVSFAKKEFADEMVHFWIAVETAKTKIDEHDAKAFRAAVVTVFITYIKSRRVKIITAVQRKKMKKMITTPGKKIPRTIFDEVQALVFDVIFERVYARFQAE